MSHESRTSALGVSGRIAAFFQRAQITPLLALVALLRRGELTAVYLVQGQRFVLHAVRTGADRGAAGVEVLAGLQPSDRFALDAVKAGLTGASPAGASGAAPAAQ